MDELKPDPELARLRLVVRVLEADLRVAQQQLEAYQHMKAQADEWARVASVAVWACDPKH
jgi:hypothetical protein